MAESKVLLLFLALIVSACGSGVTSDSATLEPTGASTTSNGVGGSQPSATATILSTTTTMPPSADLAEVLRYDPDDMAYEFWATQAPFAISEAEVFSSFRSMVEAASAIVVGRLRGIGEIVEELPDEAGGPASLDVLRIEVIGVLGGTIVDSDAGFVDVRPVVPVPSRFPSSGVILFLREMDESGGVSGTRGFSYRILSSQGILIGSPNGVTNPASAEATSTGPLEPILSEVGGLTVGEVIDRIRQTCPSPERAAQNPKTNTPIIHAAARTTSAAHEIQAVRLFIRSRSWCFPGGSGGINPRS